MPLKTLSSAILNGDLQQARPVICHGFPTDYDDEELHREGQAEKMLESFAKNLNLHPEHIVGLVTGASVYNVAVTAVGKRKLCKNLFQRREGFFLDLNLKFSPTV